MDPLVSVITPCYNGEKYLEFYFQSLLAQTYRQFELIFIDDGSTDGTSKLAHKYQSLFNQQGIFFLYLFQENAGQAAAMNRGFPYMRGKYFIWPDADDTLDPESIRKRVAFLETHPEYGCVRSNGSFIYAETNKRRSSVVFPLYNDSSQEDIFLDLIKEETYCVSGCYMIRTAVFRDIYPNLKIHESSAGQNWQILIPVAGRSKCGFIDEELYHVTIHKDSHSRQNRSLEEQVNRLLELKKVLLIGIEKSGRQDRDYQHIVDVKYDHLFFQLFLSFENKEKTKEYYQKLKKEKELTEGECRSYLGKWFPLGFLLHRVQHRITHLKE